jgi:hypothetical protein
MGTSQAKAFATEGIVAIWQGVFVCGPMIDTEHTS